MDEVELKTVGKLTDNHKAGLARMVNDPDLMSYFERVIQASNKSLIELVDKGKFEEAQFYANRIKVMQGLVKLGRDSFAHLEQLKPKSQLV